MAPKSDELLSLRRNVIFILLGARLQVGMYVWTALIAILLLRYLQFKSKCNLPLCRLVALLRLNLFTYRNLWDWLNNPFETPPKEPDPQLEFVF